MVIKLYAQDPWERKAIRVIWKTAGCSPEKKIDESVVDFDEARWSHLDGKVYDRRNDPEDNTKKELRAVRAWSGLGIMAVQSSKLGHLP